MVSSLKDHPFAVEAFFDRSIVLTFAVPKAALLHLIPECLSLDVFKDQWAFIAIAMVQTKNLRPKGFPKILGNDFFLIGYRIFVRYRDRRGKNLRGLYIIKSETNKKKMEFFGNLFTHYNYTTTDIDIVQGTESTKITSQKSRFEITLSKSFDNVSLPQNSPFEEWAAARRFAGPLPFTFTFDPISKKVLIIEGVRQNWKPKPVNIYDYHFQFLDELKLEGIVLANAFVIEKIPYYWKKGRVEIWQA